MLLHFNKNNDLIEPLSWEPIRLALVPKCVYVHAEKWLKLIQVASGWWEDMDRVDEWGFWVSMKVDGLFSIMLISAVQMSGWVNADKVSWLWWVDCSLLHCNVKMFNGIWRSFHITLKLFNFFFQSFTQMFVDNRKLLGLFGKKKLFAKPGFHYTIFGPFCCWRQHSFSSWDLQS